MGAFKYGRGQVSISIWNDWQTDKSLWSIFKAIWTPIRNVNILVFSPVDLHIYDTLGNHVGLNYTTGEIDYQIPNVYYSGPDTEPQEISILDAIDNKYKIILVGTECGPYQIKIEGNISGSLVHSEIITGTTCIGDLHFFEIISPIDGPFNLTVNSDDNPLSQ